jgi:hypothetical protein
LNLPVHHFTLIPSFEKTRYLPKYPNSAVISEFWRSCSQ